MCKKAGGQGGELELDTTPAHPGPTAPAAAIVLGSTAMEAGKACATAAVLASCKPGSG